ncbi:MAG: PEP-utilizing enzyme [Candidatus Izemoplasmatales bacterium]|jgi:phosphoenolpyruvate-protein kinase (PTS system EI component)|nr:PEP-utilizing enzyme [Candidatus Izemoplasmatales bacterium]
MLSVQGIGATNGKGAGIAVIHKKTLIKFNEKNYGQEAMALLNEGLTSAIDEIDTLIKLCNECEELDILIAHKLMLEDEEVKLRITEEINKEEELLRAVKNVEEYYYNLFKEMPSEIFNSKALDVEDVFERLLQAIKKQSSSRRINKNFILVCEELLPTTIYDYPLEYIKGIVAKKGSMFSHGIIIAKSKNLPVVIGVDISVIQQNDYLVVDGLSGKVVLISE